MLGAETWHRILNAIERLQAQKPAEGRRSARWPRLLSLIFSPAILSISSTRREISVRLTHSASAHLL
jgi:hypothetical protein